MSNVTISLTISNSDGLVERDEFLSASEAAYDRYVAEHETEQSTIAAAVAEVFDRYKGTGINMPALAHHALQALNVVPGNYKTLETRVLQYVRENASADRSVGRLFVIGKGKGGGVKRWADLPEAPATEASAS